jgi:hypothetical protein
MLPVFWEVSNHVAETLIEVAVKHVPKGEKRKDHTENGQRTFDSVHTRYLYIQKCHADEAKAGDRPSNR